MSMALSVVSARLSSQPRRSFAMPCKLQRVEILQRLDHEHSFFSVSLGV